MLQEQTFGLYQTNVSILKKIGDNYKITTAFLIRSPGFENISYVEKNSVNTKKLSCNISRAKQNIIEIGLCNPWDYFATFTISPQKYDRYNLKAFYKTFSQWLRNYRKKHKCRIEYMFIAEQHEDGAWHLHGFIYGLPVEHLHKFVKGDIMGKKIADKVLKGETVYKWQAYEDKFGWCTLEPIRDKEKAVSYILKYISKEIVDDMEQIGLGGHIFRHSQGLKKSEELKRGILTEDIPIDFENKYCRITNFDGKEYSEEYLKDIIF